MDAAKTSYERLVNCCRNLDYNIENAADKEISEEEKKLLEQAHQYRLQFEKVMDDDFNTADAISALFDLMRFINTNSGTENSKTYLASLRKEFTELSDVLGLIVDRKPEASDDETAYIEEKIKERQEARKARDFKKADAIRDELKAKGILLEDTKEGVKWTKA